MIANLSVQGFKSLFKNLQLEIRPITLLFGPNSSGKSSVLQSLILLNEILRTAITDVQETELGGSAFDVGGLHRYASVGNPMSAIGWKLRLEKPLPEVFVPRPHFDLELEYSLSTYIYEGVPALEMSVRHAGLVLIATAQRADHPSSGHSWVVTDHPLFISFVEELMRSADFRDWLAETGMNAAQIASVIGLTGTGLAVTKAESTLEQMWPRSHFEDLMVMGTEDLAELMLLTAHEVSPTLREVAGAIVTTCTDRFIIREVANGIIDDTNQDEDWAEFRQEWIRTGQEAEFGPLESFAEEFREAYALTRPHHQLSAFLWRVRDTLNSLLARLRIATDNLAYLGPIRSSPVRTLSDAGGHIVDTPLGESEWVRIARSDELRASINEWLGPNRLDTKLSITPQRLIPEKAMRAAFEDAQSIRRPKDRAAAFKNALEALRSGGLTGLLIDERTGANVDVRDVGFGISQVVPVLSRALGTRRQLHLMEQPEIHLHPALQADLADVFIKGANDQANKFILETHSEHLILRLLRRIRETNSNSEPSGLELRPSDLAVYYISRRDDGSTSAKRIEVAEDGSFLDSWPDGFFPERLVELGL